MKKTITAIFSMLITFCAYANSDSKLDEILSSGKPYATMFFDYYYVVQGDDTYPGRSWYSGNEAGDNGFSFRRVYLGYDHTFSEKFSGRVQMELTDKTTLQNGSRAFFLKEANIRWKNIYPLADLYIGHSSTPVWSVGGAEYYWGYRSIEGTVTDFRGLRSSSDSGLRLKGLFTESGMFGYNLMIGNGAGTRPEDDKYKVVYVNLWTKLLQERLYFEVFQDYNNAPGDRSIATTKGLIAWQTSAYTIAADIVHQVRSGFAFDDNDIKFFGMSFFAHADIINNRLRVFGRYDSYNPDLNFSVTHYDPVALLPYDEKFFTFGLDFKPHTNINIMPNIWVNSYKNKTDGQVTPETEVVARVTINVAFR